MKNPVYYSSGVKQNQRISSYLLEKQPLIDEKTNIDFANFIYHFAGILKFWNIQHTPQGNWQQFFHSDLSVLIASISQTDFLEFIQQYHSLNDHYLNTSLNNEKEKTLIQFFLLNINLSNRIISWIDQIMYQDNNDNTNQDIKTAVSEVVQANIGQNIYFISDCYKGMFYFFNQNPNWLAQENLEQLANKTQYFINQKFGGASSAKSNNNPPDFNTYDNFFDYQLQLFENLYSSAYQLKEQATFFFDLSLQQSNHSPHITLALALGEMMAPLQQMLNQFTQKHIDFYYRKVLLQQPLAPTPGLAPVQFVPHPSNQKSVHPQGTTLVALKDASTQPFTYKTTSDVTVSQALPVEYKTLFNSAINSNLATAVKGFTFACPIANSADGLGAKPTTPNAPWPTLGTDFSANSASKTQHLATLGFAVSSNQLLLSEGNRIITISIDFGKEALAALAHNMQILGVSWQDDDILSFWKNCFQAAYTSTNGWITIAELKTTFFPSVPQTAIPSTTTPTTTTTPSTTTTSTTTTTPSTTTTSTTTTTPSTTTTSTTPTPPTTPPTGISFIITIADDQPPVSAYSPKVHGQGYQATTPVIRFALQQEVKVANTTPTTINPYPILSTLNILQLIVKIEVAAAHNFVVQNDFSVLKLQSPFTPFGVKPVVNGNFFIGNSEIFNKKLTQLQLDIEWYDLPSFPFGFCDYYEAYNLCNPDKPFFNSVFKSEAGILIDKKWTPLPLINNQLTDSQNNTSTSNTPAPTDSAATNSTAANTPSANTDNQAFPLFTWEVLPPKTSAGGTDSPPPDKDNPDPATPGKGTDSTPGATSTSNKPATDPGDVTLTHASFLSIVISLFTAYKKLRSIVAKVTGLKDPSLLVKEIPELLDHDPAPGNKSSVFGKLSGFIRNIFKPKTTAPIPQPPTTPQPTPGAGASGDTPAKPGEQPESPKPGTGDHSTSTDPGNTADKPGTDPAKDPSSGKTPPPTGATDKDPSTPDQAPKDCQSRGEGKLKPVSSFQFNVQGLNWAPNSIPAPFSPQNKYSDQSLGGFIRFVLTAPVYAFGHDDYAAVISEIANKNLQTIAHGKPAATAPTPSDPDKPKTPPPSGTDKPATTNTPPDPQKKISTIEKILNTGLNIISIFNPAASVIKKGVDQVEQAAKDVQSATSSDSNKPASQPPASTPPSAIDFSTLLLPPRPAYIPKIKSLTASYGASTTVDFSKPGSAKDADLALFHLHPFGIVQANDFSSPITLLPRYNSEGYLYIALDKVLAPQQISLLFVLNEQSGNRENEAPKVEWTYLSNDQWQAFAPMAVQDGTNGFVQTGVIIFDLPKTAPNAQNWFIDSSQSTNKPYFWIRASASIHATSVCETINVFPHAAMAVLAGAPADNSQIAEPLPAGKITKLEQAHPGIDKVVQVTASSGHVPQETDVQFYTRVQERLRHKGRVITAWDYERMVLQYFPSIGLARCLNHTSTDLEMGILPGTVTLVVMPAQVSADEHLLTPKTNLSVIKEIKAYLRTIADPFAEIEVRNPVYEYIHITAEIRFKSGLDPGQYLNILNKGLINEICPWVNNDQNLNPFEHKFTYFSLLEYLNQPAIIEEVYHFHAYLKTTDDDEPGILLPESFDFIRPQKLWGLLTSASQHQLVAVEKTGTGPIANKPKKPGTGSPQTVHQADAAANIPAVVAANPDNERPPTAGNALFIRNNWYNSTHK